MQKYRKLTSVHSISGKWYLKLPNQPIKKRTEPKVFYILEVFFSVLMFFLFLKSQIKNIFSEDITTHLPFNSFGNTDQLKMFCIFHIIFNHLWFYAQVKRHEVNVFNVKTPLTFFKLLPKVCRVLVTDCARSDGRCLLCQEVKWNNVLGSITVFLSLPWRKVIGLFWTIIPVFCIFVS